MSGGLGGRMKRYEAVEARRRLMPLLPAVARLDGRAFHSFVRGLERPFDKRLSDLMIDTTAFLVRETNAAVGYTQSDEISLAWVPVEYESQIFFAGRVQKMTSMLAALCAAYFNRRLQEMLFQMGVNCVEYPAFFKRGTYVRRRKVSRPFTAQERESLPEKHAARGNPALVVERMECGPPALPPLATIENRAGVLFRGEEPRPKPLNSHPAEEYPVAGSG